MTALQLFFYICAALLFQQVIGIGLAAWRWRRSGMSPMLLPIEMGANGQALGWTGLCDFRVQRRQLVHALRTQSSFCLAPLDGARLPPFLASEFFTFALDIPRLSPSPRVTRSATAPSAARHHLRSHPGSSSSTSARHLREGIRNLQNCVSCHCSGHGESEGREGRDRRDRRSGRKSD